MNKSNKETNLIKKLLADQLDKKERKKLYYSNLIEKQMRKQWKENKNTPVENEIGNKIWDKIENQCIKVHKRIGKQRKQVYSSINKRLIWKMSYVVSPIPFRGLGIRRWHFKKKAPAMGAFFYYKD